LAASRSSVIHTGFANVFQIKILFRNSKTRKECKNHNGTRFPHRNGRDGVIGWIPILSDSFQFREHSSSGNFSPKLKTSQCTLDIIMEANLLHSWGGGENIICLLIFVIHSSFQTFSIPKVFFFKPKISESTRKAKGGPPLTEGVGVGRSAGS